MERTTEQPRTIDWCEIAQEHLPGSTSCQVYRVRDDTTDYYEVDYGDVLLLNDVGYVVRGTESEKKFGLEGEPKPWVKSCVDLISGERKVIKLTFLEEFPCRIEGLKYTCLRNPDKEARILEKTRGNPAFMQGFAVLDAKGNNVRVLDRIRGMSLDNVIRSIRADHETYYHDHLPGMLDGLVYAYREMHGLHEMGEIHGDVTPDHIYVERENGRFVWIDFDYDYKEENDLVIRDIFEMGTLLSFVVGKEYMAYQDVKTWWPALAERIRPEDMQSVFPNQLANLKIVYPYISDALNNVLLRFSRGSKDRYTSAADLADDIAEARKHL